MEMGEEYGLPDHLRHLMAGKAYFAGHHHQYCALVMEETLHSCPPPPPPLVSPAAAAVAYPVQGGLRAFGFSGEGGGGAPQLQARWPRQETLTLLEIRSRLDSRFREAAASQKPPMCLWDEVARIMSEEHGYQRSGKKCKEKLENLHKYHKKTKEGKAGRQDGKRYRFFRQLEALYGENTDSNKPPLLLCRHIPKPAAAAIVDHYKLRERLGLSHLSGFTSSASSEEEEEEDYDVDEEEEEEDDDSNTKNEAVRSGGLKRGRKSWRSSIIEMVNIQLRRIMEVQEAWLDKMLKALEHMEEERICREESWRKQEAARVDLEQKQWAEERAWVEARDAALLTALEKISKRGRTKCSPSPEELTAIEACEDSNDRQEGESVRDSSLLDSQS